MLAHEAGAAGVAGAAGAAAGALGVVLLHQHRSLRPELLVHPSEVVSTAVEPGAAETR